MNSKKKLIIAIDVDDVLAANAQGWAAYSNANWATNFTVDDYDEDWAKVWGIPHDENEVRRMQVFRSGFFGKHDRIDGAKPVLEKLARKYRLVIVTSRPELVRAETLRWVDQHFPGLFEAIEFSGFYDKYSSDEAAKATKADLVQKIGAGYLIDDQLKHCLAAASVGVASLLFGDYAWNQADHLPPNVQRVKDWAAVLQYFNEQS